MRILIRFNQSSVELGNDGQVLSNKKCVCGSTVAVLMSKMERERFPFAGFCPKPASNYQLVKVLDVISYSTSDEQFSGDSISVPLTSYCIGIYVNGKVWLLVENDRLLTRPFKMENVRLKCNVVDIHSRNTIN
jgi:hypothetical protein